MRLTNNQIVTIKHLTKKFFGKNAIVYLFGSRTDDNRKGGDIDIYIETREKGSVFEKKIEMLAELEKEFGQRKIDIVINNFRSHLPVYDIAKQEGILL